MRRLLVGFAVLGVFAVPLATFLSFFLDERFGLSPGGRSLFFAFSAAVAIVALRLYGTRGEEAFGRDPARVLDQGAWGLVVAVVLICSGALLPWLPAVAVAFAGAGAVVVCMLPALTLAMFSVVPSRMRPHVAALTQIYFAGVGGVGGAILLGGIDRRFGVAGAMLALSVPGIVGSLIIRSAKRHLNADIDRMIADTIEEEEVRGLAASGTTLPLRTCKGLRSAYGELQVLFDVDFTVDDGEMVALLGTNGACKSTLLKVIAGVELPFQGTVRYGGQDITYLSAERRVRLGITQVPAGRANFGPLTVVENLRLFGHTRGRDGPRLDATIGRCFDIFPQLAQRRNHAAQTLSGGEQQMLALCKALVLQPRLLMIDELSLGLAPNVVAQLLEVVREINARGTAIILVEQSVNVALQLVDHAYFMEKGQMRFDGRASVLLQRDDLLRAVFLGGADDAWKPGTNEGAEGSHDRIEP